jgi:hypothetical protein
VDLNEPPSRKRQPLAARQFAPRHRGAREVANGNLHTNAHLKALDKRSKSFAKRVLPLRELAKLLAIGPSYWSIYQTWRRRSRCSEKVGANRRDVAFCATLSSV